MLKDVQLTLYQCKKCRGIHGVDDTSAVDGAHSSNCPHCGHGFCEYLGYYNAVLAKDYEPEPEDVTERLRNYILATEGKEAWEHFEYMADKYSSKEAHR